MKFFLFALCLSLVSCHEVIRPQDKAIEYNNRGLEALGQRDYESAIEQFSNAIEVSPEFAGAWSNLGIAYFYRGDREKALKALEESVRIDYKLPEARNNLGVVLKELGETERAKAEFRMAIKLNKDYAEPYFHLGLMAGEEGKWGEARKLLEHALDIEPEFKEAGKNLGIVYLKLGLIDKAVRRLKITLEGEQDDGDLFDALGYALFLKGEYNDSFNYFSKAIEINPDNAYYYLHRGIVSIELSRMEIAKSDFKKAHSLGNNLIEPLFLLSILRLKEGERKTAEEYLKKIRNSIKFSDDILIKEYTEKILKELEKWKE